MPDLVVKSHVDQFMSTSTLEEAQALLDINTSNLAYLPLSGGTLTGGISGTNATFQTISSGQYLGGSTSNPYLFAVGDPTYVGTQQVHQIIISGYGPSVGGTLAMSISGSLVNTTISIYAPVGSTWIDWAQSFRSSLSSTPAVSQYYTIGGGSSIISFTRKLNPAGAAYANDPTLGTHFLNYYVWAAESYGNTTILGISGTKALSNYVGQSYYDTTYPYYTEWRTLSGLSDWQKVADSRYATISSISSLASGAAQKSANLSDLASIPTARANLLIEGNEVTEATASRILSLADCSKFIICTYTGGQIDITVQQQSVVPYPNGTVIMFLRGIGAGAISITGAGVTINNNTSSSVAAGGSMAIRKRNATDVWDFI